MASITCTNCGAVLKTPTAIAPGKKVKCPKCQQAFVVEEEKPAEEEEVAAAGGDEDEEAPKKKGKGDDEEGGDEDGEAPKKGKDGKKSNKNLILIIVACVVLFCCCPTICANVYYFAWGAISTAIGMGAKGAADKQVDDIIKKAKEDADKAKK